jgi:hypothetical protein
VAAETRRDTPRRIRLLRPGTTARRITQFRTGYVSRIQDQDVRPDCWRGCRLSLAARFIAVVLQSRRRPQRLFHLSTTADASKESPGRAGAFNPIPPAHFTLSPHKFHALAESCGQNMRGQMAWGRGDVSLDRYPGHQSRLDAPPLSTGAALHARPWAEVVRASRPISPPE